MSLEDGFLRGEVQVLVVELLADRYERVPEALPEGHPVGVAQRADRVVRRVVRVGHHLVDELVRGG